MNVSQFSVLCCLIASLFGTSAAFVNRHVVVRAPSATTRASTPLPMMMEGAAADIIASSSSAASASVVNQLNNLLVATIDADIANISDNEFAPIFAGGILVMCGGVLSALIVGFILESNDSYANVIADSYVQGAEDEEFWKGLSEEEKKKTQDLLQKLKDSKEGGGSSEVAPTLAAPVAAVAESVQETTLEAPKEESPAKTETAATPGNDKDPGMFSDY